MDVQCLADDAHRIFSAVFAQAEELQQRAVQKMVDNFSVHHEAWSTERLQMVQQLQEFKERAKALEHACEGWQELHASERQQYAETIVELSSKLQACQDKLRQAEASTAEEKQQHADELAKTRDQLQVALEYRKKCRSQQAELKHLHQRIAELQAKQQHASEQNRRADSQPACQHSLKKSHFTTSSVPRPAQTAQLSAQPTRSHHFMAGAVVESQATSSQDNEVLCSQVTGLLQRLQEAEKRVQQESQKRHAERKNVREVLRHRDEELKALKAENEGLRQQLNQLGALQAHQRSGRDGPCTVHPHEDEATSRPSGVCPRPGVQQAEQLRALPAPVVTPKASGRSTDRAQSQSKAHDSASALKAKLRAGSGSCSRAAQYEGRRDGGSSPGKRAMPDAADASMAQQRATPAKRPKRDECIAVEKQRQSTGASSAPVIERATGASAKQSTEDERLRAKHAEEPLLASRRTLQPADVAHLQSAQNVRNSQDAEPGEPGNIQHLSESPEAPHHVSTSQLASTALPLCTTTREHLHRSSDVAVSGRGVVALRTKDDTISRKTGCGASAERNAEAAGMGSAQLEPVSGPPGTGEVAEVDLVVQPGSERPESDPQVAAEPVAVQSLLRPAVPAVTLEADDTAVAVVKEESLRDSPAWKARAAREAAQHTGNTLFAELICQPDLAKDDQGEPEGVGLLTQLLGPNRHTAQEQQKAGANWKTRQKEGLCPGALAFLDVAHVQRNSNPRIGQHLPTIVDRHSPKNFQRLQVAKQAGLQSGRPTDAGEGYKYKEVVRKKAEREDMLGVECTDCQRFYEACQTWNSIAPTALPKCGHAVQDAGQKARVAAAPERVTRDQLRQNASRHRYHYAPPPTPPGFWDMGFMDTQDSRNVGQKDDLS